MNRYGDRARLAAERQRGVVLFVALIVLIIMTLAGLALLRQMGAGTSIAGNVAFKESATSVADRGTEFARNWITGNRPAEAFDLFTAGYHSSWTGPGAWGDSVDPTKFDWSNTYSVLLPANPDDAQTGNSARIIIQRLCALPNLPSNAATQNCSSSAARNQGQSQGGTSYGTPAPLLQAAPYFRVTSRVTGVRGTVSYTQVILQ
jgi:type IV pilus assembly protein PilX